MRIQQSVFIFGEAKRNAWGSAPLLLPGPEGSGKRGELLAIAISPELKAAAYELNRSALFGHSTKTMFPDFEGFSRAHAAESGFEEDFFRIPGKRLP